MQHFIYESSNCKGVTFRHKVSPSPKAGALFRKSMHKRFHTYKVLDWPEQN